MRVNSTRSQKEHLSYSLFLGALIAIPAIITIILNAKYPDTWGPVSLLIICVIAWTSILVTLIQRKAWKKDMLLELRISPFNWPGRVFWLNTVLFAAVGLLNLVDMNASIRQSVTGLFQLTTSMLWLMTATSKVRVSSKGISGINLWPIKWSQIEQCEWHSKVNNLHTILLWLRVPVFKRTKVTCFVDEEKKEAFEELLSQYLQQPVAAP